MFMVIYNNKKKVNNEDKSFYLSQQELLHCDTYCYVDNVLQYNFQATLGSCT